MNENEWVPCAEHLPFDDKKGSVSVEFKWIDGEGDYILHGYFERWVDAKIRATPHNLPYERFGCVNHPRHGCEWWWANEDSAPTHWRYAPQKPSIDSEARS